MAFSQSVQPGSMQRLPNTSTKLGSVEDILESLVTCVQQVELNGECVSHGCIFTHRVSHCTCDRAYAYICRLNAVADYSFLILSSKVAHYT